MINVSFLFLKSVIHSDSRESCSSVKIQVLYNMYLGNDSESITVYKYKVHKSKNYKINNQKILSIKGSLCNFLANCLFKGII